MSKVAIELVTTIQNISALEGKQERLTAELKAVVDERLALLRRKQLLSRKLVDVYPNPVTIFEQIAHENLFNYDRIHEHRYTNEELKELEEEYGSIPMEAVKQ